MTIFGLVKSGLEKNILKLHVPLQRYLLTCQANSAFLGRFFCTGQQQLWRLCWNFKIIFSRPLIIIIFKPKMVSNPHKNFLCIFWHQKPTVNSKLFASDACFAKLVYEQHLFAKAKVWVDSEKDCWLFLFWTRIKIENNLRWKVAWWYAALCHPCSFLWIDDYYAPNLKI